jgi:hypothetical protein
MILFSLYFVFFIWKPLLIAGLAKFSLVEIPGGRSELPDKLSCYNAGVARGSLGSGSKSPRPPARDAP